MVQGCQSCIPSLAAGPLSAARSGALTPTWATSTAETRVGGPRCGASSRLSRRDRRRREIATGSRGCRYKTASGRLKWPNRDPINEAGFNAAARNVGNSDPNQELNLYAFVFNSPNGFIDSDGLSGTIAVPWRPPIPLPPVTLPGWAPPVAAGAVGFGIGWSVGTWLNNNTAVGNLHNVICKVRVIPRPSDEECRKEWEEAYKKCAEELAKPNPDPVYTIGGPGVRNCARGLVSEACGGNPVDYGGRGRRRK